MSHDQSMPLQSPTVGAIPSRLWLLSLLAGLLAVITAVGLRVEPEWLPAMALFLAVTAAAILRPAFGLAWLAFAILPLYPLQYELAGVTINYPEALMFCLLLRAVLAAPATTGNAAPSASQLALAPFLFAALLALATAALRGTELKSALQDGRQFTEYVLLYLLVLHGCRKPAHAATLLAAFVAGAALVAVHGILQHYTGWGIPRKQLVHDQIVYGGVRSGSFFGATALGAMMVLAIGPALGLAVYAMGPNGKRPTKPRLLTGLFLALALLLAAGAYYTQTRAAWLAIAFELLLLFLLLPKRPAATVAAALLVAAGAIAVGPQILDRLATLTLSKSEKSLLQRTEYYTAAWHIFREHPMLGLGWGAYYEKSELLLNARYVERQPPLRLPSVAPTESTVHSAYLQILVKTGLVGLAAFLCLLLHWVLLGTRALRYLDRESENYALLAGAAVALLAYLVHAGVENFFQWPAMSQSFWLLAAVVCVLATQPPLTQTECHQEEDSVG